jgi:hypothetical protein
MELFIGKLLNTLEGHSSIVHSVAVSSDSNNLRRRRLTLCFCTDTKRNENFEVTTNAEITKIIVDVE